MTAPRHCAWCGKVGVAPKLSRQPFYQCMHCGRSMTPAGLVVPEPGVWPGTFLKQELAKRDARHGGVLGRSRKTARYARLTAQ